MVVAAKAESVSVPAPQIERVVFRISGTSPLIVHRFSQKAIEQILSKQMKRASSAKEAKDPERDFEESLYRLPGGGYGFPSLAVKAAMVRAGTYADQKMTFLRGAFHINGERDERGDDLLRIIGEPEPREDMVRLQGSTADVRYRAQFFPWAADVPIRFNARAISQEQLANLLVVAGFAVGIGEWRPEKDGESGMWEVV